MTRENDTETETTDDRPDRDGRPAEHERDLGAVSPTDATPAVDATGDDAVTDAGLPDGSVSERRVRPDPPTPSDPAADAAAVPEGVLTPDDLERAARQLRELDGERVLVPTGEGPPAPDDRVPGRPGEAEPLDDRVPGTDTGAGTAYAVDVSVRTDRGTASGSFRSNDVREVFEELLRWYAGRVDPDRDPETVLAVLLAASDLDVTGR